MEAEPADVVDALPARVDPLAELFPLAAALRLVLETEPDPEEAVDAEALLAWLAALMAP